MLSLHHCLPVISLGKVKGRLQIQQKGSDIGITLKGDTYVRTSPPSIAFYFKRNFFTGMLSLSSATFTCSLCSDSVTPA